MKKLGLILIILSLIPLQSLWAESLGKATGLISNFYSNPGASGIFTYWEADLAFTDPPGHIFGEGYSLSMQFDEAGLAQGSWEISNGQETFQGNLLSFTQTFLHDDPDNRQSIYSFHITLQGPEFENLLLSGTAEYSWVQPFSVRSYTFNGILEGEKVDPPVSVPGASAAALMLCFAIIGFFGCRQLGKMNWQPKSDKA